MRHDLSPARFFRSGGLVRLLQAGAQPLRAPEPRERDPAARAGEWAHLKAWMRLGDAARGARPQPG